MEREKERVISGCPFLCQVTDGLYSPQVESEQFESITKQVKELVQGFMDRMFIEQVEVSTQLRVHIDGQHVDSVMLSQMIAMWKLLSLNTSYPHKHQT